MELCSFEVTVNSHINLPHGHKIFFYSVDNRRVAITCTPSDGARITSYDNKDYSWLMAKSPELRTLTFSVNSRKGIQREAHYVKTSLDCTQLFGSIDIVKYTSICLLFEIEDRSHFMTDTGFQELTEWARSVIRQFIDVYRLTANETDIVKFSDQDSAVIRISFAKDYIFNEHNITATLLDTQFSITIDFRHTFGYFKEPLSVDLFNKIQDRLRNGKQLELAEQLLLDAIEQSSSKDDNDLAIVIAETAFETFLQSRLVLSCKNTGTARFPRGKGKKMKMIDSNSAIERGNVQIDLLEFADYLLKFKPGQVGSVKLTKEFTEWKREAYDLRNGIVHRGVRGSTYQQFFKAFESVVAFINFLSGALP